jgi:RHS repeat-associated protein
LLSYAYTYDANGNRLSMTTLEGTATYAYDGDNRLLSATYTGITANAENYQYDGAGNRTTLNGTPYTYDAADRLQSAGSTTYGFDANGNLTLKSENGQTTHYHYDGENRLVRVALPSGEELAFQYDPFGNRIGQAGQGTTTRYLLDGDNVLMELDAAGNTLARYTTGLTLDSWISMERGGQSYFYHTDGLGSTTALTNGSQAISATYQYDAYGKLLAQTGAVTNPYTYTGREYDATTGLYYYRTRYYDAAVGRFLTRDGFSGFQRRPLSLNRYSFVEGNAINNVDPDGEFFKNFVSGLLGAGLSALPDIEEHGTNFKCYDWGGILTSFATGFISFGSLSKGISLLGRANRLEKALPTLSKRRGMENEIRKGVPGLKKRYKTDEEYIGKIQRFRNEGKQEIVGGLIDNAGNAKSLAEYGAYRYTKDNPCSFTNGGSGNSPSSGGAQEKERIDPTPYEDGDDDLSPPGSGVPNPGSGDKINIPIDGSFDPNEIIAPEGCGLERWVAGQATLPYTILYENDPDFATAPAQTVFIEHIFDEEINPFSFRLGDFGFGSYYFSVPANVSYYSTRIDLSDSLNVLLDVTAGLDAANRRVFWILESKDPATGFAATLPASVGFLPVNDTLTRAGEGFVNFTVRPRNTAATGDTIHAVADIIFDDNLPIRTNLAFNRVDADAPLSEITAIDTLPDHRYRLHWTGSDEGSGIVRYLLYASVNEDAYLPLADNITASPYTFQGLPDSTYRFFTVAVDCAGNIEPLKDSGCTLVLADTTVVQPVGMAANGSITLAVNGAVGNVTYTWSPEVSTTATATSLSPGVYAVTVTDLLGCSLSLSLELDAVVSTTTPTARPNDLFIHRLYPVPAHAELTVEFSAPARHVWLEVFGPDGKSLLAQTLDTQPGQLNQTVLDVSRWPAGSYTVRIRTKAGSVSGVFLRQ